MRKNRLTYEFILARILGFCAFACALFLISTGIPPHDYKTHPFLFKGILSGTNEGIVVPGSQFASFRNFIASDATISLILDQPLDTDRDAEMLYYDAQNCLCPIVLNRKPVENSALVHCSSMARANQRLSDTGYVWFLMLGDGKGIAVKKQ